jgi:DNA helicase-2/ATP-dependent DNA helicase PcrA
MRYLCDLHVHSKYARATSRSSDLEHLAEWATYKGLDIIGTGDFTHPAWFRELEQRLEETEPGLFQLKQREQLSHPVRFMLTTELACIYSQGGKVRRLHLCVFAPSLAAVAKLNAALVERGCNIRSDGRPILGMSGYTLLELLLQLDPGLELMPAHAWTPWFAVFGSKSGFDSLEECFGDLTGHINTIETGLSSDPAMNWRLPGLDKLLLLSNSDAHSPQKLGREANAFDLDELSYVSFLKIVRQRDHGKLLFTVEFFPEEGMYHFDGHRACSVSSAPTQTKMWNNICPKCSRPLTVGVLHRVDNLSQRPEGFVLSSAPSYRSLVPLAEIIADAYDVGVSSKRVQQRYINIVRDIMPELPLLLDSDNEILSRIGDTTIVEGIRRVRAGELTIEPGFDGQYGTVKVFTASDRKKLAQQSLI